MEIPADDAAYLASISDAEEKRRDLLTMGQWDESHVRDYVNATIIKPDLLSQLMLSISDLGSGPINLH